MKKLKVVIITISVILLIGLLRTCLSDNTCSLIYSGYRNTETGECQTFSSCERKGIPEKYVFDEECWHEHEQFVSRFELERQCKKWCNESSYNFLCDTTHSVMHESDVIRCSDVLK